MNPTTKFMFDAANAASNSLKLIEESVKYTQPRIGADVYSDDKLELKLENDARFFASLTSVLEESENIKYFEHLEVLLEATQDLFKEVNMKPRTCSAAVDTQELTESTISGIYAKHFTESVNKDFSLPLFEGTLLTDHKEEAKLLTEASIRAGITHEIDNELFLKYALFESTLVDNCRQIILPTILEERTDNFIEQQDNEYFEIFDKNARSLKTEINESIVQMVALIAPKLFEESAGLKDTGVFKFAGISAALI